MIRKTKVFWSSLAPAACGRLREDSIVLTFPENAVDDASADQRAKIGALYAFLLAANAAVWTWALIALAGRPTLLGTAFLAYVLGLRHAVDADHIAAIDNVVRKLMQEGKRPYRGRPVLLARPFAVDRASPSRRIAATAFALQGRFDAFKSIGSVIGTGASAFFLLAIAVINLVILRGVWRSFRARAPRRAGRRAGAQRASLRAAALLARIFRPLFRMVSRSWQMFPVGFLFGLGFDTATEISLFTVAASQASGGMTLRHGHDLPGFVHRRHDAGRHHRQRADGRRLRLGVPQSDPQDLVQSHHHRHFRPRRAR